MRIAVDGMGGDHAPVEIVKGCVYAINEMDIEISLFGKREVLEPELAKYHFDKNKIHIRHTNEVITNEDKPVQGIKNKKNSSMVVGLDMVKSKEADAFISAGNTGALLAGSLFRVGRIKGIDRPAIGSVYPTKKGISLLVDAGANAECKPRNLMEFSLMGRIYVEKVLGRNNPKVGIVNIGSEEEKGNQLVKDSSELLFKNCPNFVGSVEAREIPDGVVDVIVCDGFVGNVILKLTEGVAMNMLSMMKEQFQEKIQYKIGAIMLKSAFRELKKKLDYTEYGGAPLLGVEGVVIKAHGSSNAKAIKNAIRQAVLSVENNVVELIKDEIFKTGDENSGK